jgi:hypothetical protein
VASSAPGAIVFEPVGTLLVPVQEGRGEEAPLEDAPGAHDLLDELAADQVLLAALAPEGWSGARLTDTLERHGMRRSFPCVVAGEASHAAAVEKALGRLRVPAPRTWVVGPPTGPQAPDVPAGAGFRVRLDATPGRGPAISVASLPALRMRYLESQRPEADAPPEAREGDS